MTIQITANGRNFSQAVKYLKKIGGLFNGSTKLWTVPAGSIDDSDCRLWGLRIVQTQPACDLVDLMDAPNSSL